MILKQNKMDIVFYHNSLKSKESGCPFSQRVSGSRSDILKFAFIKNVEVMVMNKLILSFFIVVLMQSFCNANLLYLTADIDECLYTTLIIDFENLTEGDVLKLSGSNDIDSYIATKNDKVNQQIRWKLFLPFGNYALQLENSVPYHFNTVDYANQIIGNDNKLSLWRNDDPIPKRKATFNFDYLKNYEKIFIVLFDGNGNFSDQYFGTFPFNEKSNKKGKWSTSKIDDSYYYQAIGIDNKGKCYKFEIEKD